MKAILIILAILLFLLLGEVIERLTYVENYLRQITDLLREIRKRQ